MKVHYPKLYNMAHLLSLNVFTASKGSNNYILFNICHFLVFQMNKVAYYEFLLVFNKKKKKKKKKNRETIKRFAYLPTLIFFGMLAETQIKFLRLIKN